MLEYPLLSQERVKLRTSNFVRTFIASIGTKAHENVGNSSDWRSQGVQKISGHPRIGRMGALRGYLCDSTAFLLEYLWQNLWTGFNIFFTVASPDELQKRVK